MKLNLEIRKKYSTVHEKGLREIEGRTAPVLETTNNFEWFPSHYLKQSTAHLFKQLWNADHTIREFLLTSSSLADARERTLMYLNTKEADYFDLDSFDNLAEMNITERSNAKECIRIFKNMVRTENEHRTGFSALEALRNAFINQNNGKSVLTQSFMCEIISLLHGINGRGLSFLAHGKQDVHRPINAGHEVLLDEYAQTMEQTFSRFVNGSNPNLVERQKMVKQRILEYYGATGEEWNNYEWHLHHIFTDSNGILSIVNLSVQELAGLKKAAQEHIPIQITPYYLSLFNPAECDESDRAIRAQVLPSASYCTTVAANRARGADMDYMGEHFTSPVEGITRRYPHIVILKVFDSCPQICVYCQRNWEIRDLEHGSVGKTKLDRAIAWIREHDEITEVLVTGGDPLTLDNGKLGRILDALADIDHVDRIRIGTRTIVTMPCRIDNGFLGLLRAYHKPGRREIAIMTHVEHATELTPDVIDAVTKIRQCGIGVYNQQVFTYYNSRRFETAYLRKNLRLCGIDPYYTFNTKGKEETADFRVPIARVLQERKEEARLLPGLARTDEPVFNVPRIGKSHLRSWQDHEPIMILADGRRVYRFFPWESRLTLSDDYLYTDVPIYDYLKRLLMAKEDVDQYRTIWYYF